MRLTPDKKLDPTMNKPKSGLLNKQAPRGLRPSDQPTDKISDKLRTFYQTVQEEEIPDKFLDLLEKLDSAEKNQTGAK